MIFRGAEQSCPECTRPLKKSGDHLLCRSSHGQFVLRRGLRQAVTDASEGNCKKLMPLPVESSSKRQPCPLCKRDLRPSTYAGVFALVCRRHGAWFADRDFDRMLAQVREKFRDRLAIHDPSRALVHVESQQSGAGGLLWGAFFVLYVIIRVMLVQ